MKIKLASDSIHKAVGGRFLFLFKDNAVVTWHR